MRTRTLVREMLIPTPPPALVLQHSRRWRTVRTIVVELVILGVLVLIGVGAAHRARAHSGSGVECCASATAAKGR